MRDSGNYRVSFTRHQVSLSFSSMRRVCRRINNVKKKNERRSFLAVCPRHHRRKLLDKEKKNSTNRCFYGFFVAPIGWISGFCSRVTKRLQLRGLVFFFCSCLYVCLHTCAKYRGDKKKVLVDLCRFTALMVFMASIHSFCIFPTQRRKKTVLRQSFARKRNKKMVRELHMCTGISRQNTFFNSE